MASNLVTSRTIASRECPVCKCRCSKLLFSQAFEQLSIAQLLDGYDVVVCENCGAGYADRIPPQAAFDVYYCDLSKYEYEHRGGKGSAYSDLCFRETAKSIIECVPDREAEILEIGCATGQLLSVLGENGYRNLKGVDPSPGCAKMARELYGVHVDVGSVFEIPLPEQPLDLVILCGVLEHIRDLEAAVDKLRELLSPGGLAYIAVPDVSCFCLETDAPFQEFSVEHINFFSARSLTNLMQGRGFRFVDGGKALLEYSRATWCATTYGVFHNARSGPLPPQRDEETERGLTEYIRKSHDADARVRVTIEQGAANRGAVLVWGTGAHTQRLLSVGAFGKVQIAAFVDSSPKHQGQQLHGAPVLSPQQLKHRTEPILISSYSAQDEIVGQIRGKWALDNELILLYEL